MFPYILKCIRKALLDDIGVLKEWGKTGLHEGEFRGFDLSAKVLDKLLQDNLVIVGACK